MLLKLAIRGLLTWASEAAAPLVLGRHGRRSLNDDSVTGDDPLAAFSPQTAAFLRRLASYSNVGDIVVNSVFERKTGQSRELRNGRGIESEAAPADPWRGWVRHQD